MRLSAKTEYASLAVLELALRQDRDEPVRIREISEAHGVPSRFLVQILLQLKAAGLVTSTRGSAGGYRLARDASEITLADIFSQPACLQKLPRIFSKYCGRISG